MSLNIKNEPLHKLIRELAEQTGQTQTGVVATAVEQYAEDVNRERDYDEAEAILRDMQRRVRESTQPLFKHEDLYDPVTGLPA